MASCVAVTSSRSSASWKASPIAEPNSAIRSRSDAGVPATMAPASQAKRIRAPVFIACRRMMPVSSGACVLGGEIERLAARHAAGAGCARKAQHELRLGLRQAGPVASLAMMSKAKVKQAVARQDRGRLVEGAVHGGLATAQIVVVHGRQVVVDQRIAVDAFERRRDAAGGIAVMAEHRRRSPSPGRAAAACRRSGRRGAWPQRASPGVRSRHPARARRAVRAAALPRCGRAIPALPQRRLRRSRSWAHRLRQSAQRSSACRRTLRLPSSAIMPFGSAARRAAWTTRSFNPNSRKRIWQARAGAGRAVASASGFFAPSSPSSPSAWCRWC